MLWTIFVLNTYQVIIMAQKNCANLLKRYNEQTRLLRGSFGFLRG